jgi:hypothetical protein
VFVLLAAIDDPHWLGEQEPHLLKNGSSVKMTPRRRPRPAGAKGPIFIGAGRPQTARPAGMVDQAWPCLAQAVWTPAGCIWSTRGRKSGRLFDTPCVALGLGIPPNSTTSKILQRLIGMNRHERRKQHLPKLTPKQAAELRSEGAMSIPVHTTKLVRQMLGADTTQLAADIAAKALDGAAPDGWRRGFKAAVNIGPPSNMHFRVAVGTNQSVLIGFEHDPEYDGALVVVDDAGNVVKDDAGNPVKTAEAAFTTILPMENEDTEKMLRELRPTEVWECQIRVNAEGKVQTALIAASTDWAWLSEVYSEGYDPDGPCGPTYYRVTDTHYYSVFLKPQYPGNAMLLMTRLNQEVAEPAMRALAQYRAQLDAEQATPGEESEAHEALGIPASSDN